MKTDQQIRRWLILLISAVLNIGTATVSAQGTAFNYQGKLSVNGTPANGSYDLTFELFSDSGGVNRLGNAFTNLNTAVINGLFAVMLDFGSGIFMGTSVWLQIGVRTNGGGAFTRLTPLQPILPMPYAIMANTASSLLGTLSATQVSGSLPASQLSGTVPDGRLSGNVAFLNANQTFTGANVFNSLENNFTGSFHGSGAGLTNLNNGVPVSTLVLSRTLGNPALNAAGFVLSATQLGPDWVPVNTDAPWRTRAYFGAVTNNGRMWLLGGSSGASSSYNDVWSSVDGLNWTQVVAAAPWSEREGHMTVVLHESLYVLGGYNRSNQSYVNDVWNSQGGTNWFRWTAAARWSPRWYSASVVFNDRIWVFGGFDGTFRNDVWYSPDGLNWIVGTTAAAWSGRQGHAAVVFNGKMWVIGGLRTPNFTPVNDVWSSSDGTNWTMVTSGAAWNPRAYFTLTAFDGKLWVTGGYDGNLGVSRSDVWSSADGFIWRQATNAAAWSPRRGHAAVAFNGQLWVLSGSCDSIGCNDVWSSQSITNMLGQFYLFQKQ
jgi:Kelch motif protein